jgi:hypothetical protein
MEDEQGSSWRHCCPEFGAEGRQGTLRIMSEEQFLMFVHGAEVRYSRNRITPKALIRWL